MIESEEQKITLEITALHLEEIKFMKHLFTFVILIFLKSCGSNDSSSGIQTTRKTLPPPILALEEPNRIPGTDPTPTIKVSGVKVGSTVTLYKDPSCDTQTQASDSVEVGSDGEVLITSYDLSGDGEVTFYAAVGEGQESDPVCLSASVSYAFDLIVPDAPNALALEGPSTSPHISPTPTLKVSGVEERATVTLYRDSSCEMQMSDGIQVERGKDEVSITSYSLGDGGQDIEVNFYALQRDEAGNESPCSSASVSYIADLTVPSKPTALSLSSPDTSPGPDPTPTLLVEGLEEGANVTLYLDSSCSNPISSAQIVQAGQTSALITSHHLGDVDRSVDYYSVQVDIFGRSSGCSTASISYGFDYILPEPTGLSLSSPGTSPGFEIAPVILVEGVEEGARVTLYSDNSCSTPLSSAHTVPLGQTSVLITSYHLGSVDVTVDYYSVQRTDLETSGCSTASVSYGFIYVPLALSEVSVETGSYFYDDPSGDILEINTTFNRNVIVTGTPRIELTIGTATRYAHYASGSGTSTLVFHYDVSRDDYDNDGIQTATIIDLAEGTIKDGARENAPLNFTTLDNLGRVFINFEEKIFSTEEAFAFLKKGGSVVTWGHSDYGGNSDRVSGDLARGVSKVFSARYAFAALKGNGSVVTWGDARYGGNSDSVSLDLESGVSEVFSTRYAFAALKGENGSVVTWGDARYGGNSDSVSGELVSGVSEIFSTGGAFAALKEGGFVVTWGTSDGGDSSSVSGDLVSGVSEIFSTWNAFAALKSNGSVVTWGNGSSGGNSGSVSHNLGSGVIEIFSTNNSFAALKENGSVVTWGNNRNGGNSSGVSPDLESGVSKIFSTDRAFAALKGESGSVVTWGRDDYGGNSSGVSSDLESGVSEIFSTDGAFAALKGENGSVVTWGNDSFGGNSGSVSGDLESGVIEIFSTHRAFAALNESGSVMTWGDSGYGGNSAGVSSDLESRVIEIFSTDRAFAALKEDGSVVTWGSRDYGGDSSGVDLDPRW